MDKHDAIRPATSLQTNEEIMATCRNERVAKKEARKAFVEEKFPELAEDLREQVRVFLQTLTPEIIRDNYVRCERKRQTSFCLKSMWLNYEETAAFIQSEPMVAVMRELERAGYNVHIEYMSTPGETHWEMKGWGAYEGPKLRLNF